MKWVRESELKIVIHHIFEIRYNMETSPTFAN
jgi:hypothetical protein